MAYTKSGGIFAGLDDTDPVLRGLDDTDPVLRGIDDQRGVYSLAGYGARRSLRGLGEVPPGTSDAKKKSTRKSYYYLYLLASLTPKFRRILGVSAGVSIAGMLTGPGGLLIAAAAGGIGVSAAAGVENTALETTLWWMKGGNKDARAYLKSALIEGDTRELLLKAIDKLEEASKGRTSQERVAGRARRYFLDFIAIGPQSGLRSLTPAQQAAFGAAYLDALGSGAKENLCLAAGTSASNRAKNKGATSAAFLAAKRAKEAAQARRQAAIGAARAAAAVAAERKASLDAAKARLRAAARGTAAAAKAEQEAIAAEAQAADAAAAAQQAEQEATVATAEEQQLDSQVKAAEAQVDAETQPTPEEKKAAEAQDSEADKIEDKAAVAEDTAKGTTVAPDASAPPAPAAGGGGGGLLPVVVAAGALALGAPALPVVGAAAALAFLMRKK